MNMIRKRINIVFLVPILLSFVACKKDSAGDSSIPSDFKLSYGDSILYEKSVGADNLVYPQHSYAGSYSGFPEGIEIDEKTGAINLSKSETGLRYRINFIADDNSFEYTTTVLLSGVNYFDAFYYLSKNDTVANAIYNGNPNNTIPISPAGTVFDIGLGCNNEGIAVSTADGKINLMQTIRNGFFGRYPDNATRKEFELKYKINDQSQQREKSLKIKLYYFNTIDDVTADLRQLLRDREGTIFGANPITFPGEILSSPSGADGVAKVAKPRPPCIFIIGR